ncbi:response regulator [uncultured Thiodictyon sp.]|jgi:CheY-like chemotaxis protein|uniref:response regulator n=1 Tax=uncultured Thiodictyon sp. TaxID=1846217 RepID=UPI0025ECB6E1|nr:response regulator [uncultured Thiodictyon sp.]
MPEQHSRPLLIVEDSDEDFALTRWALGRAGCERPLLRTTRVDDTLALLCPCALPPQPERVRPCAVLLDLNLSDGTGLEVLEALRADRADRPLPIVVMTTSKNPRDIAQCYRLGAAGYLIKPMERDLFAEQMHAFVRYWFQAVALPL